MSTERADVLAGSCQGILDSSAVAYLNELAAEIIANGNPAGDLLTEATAAHDRRQRFMLEMADGGARRAKLARRVIGASVFAAANIRSVFEQCEREDEEATCKESLQVAYAALARAGAP